LLYIPVVVVVTTDFSSFFLLLGGRCCGYDLYSHVYITRSCIIIPRRGPFSICYSHPIPQQQQPARLYYIYIRDV
jgi:hypothetical protein